MGYKYITQEVIDSGEFYADNAEAAEEARQYNASMAGGLRAKDTYLKMADFFKSISIITFLMGLCIVLKPLVFPGAGNVNFGAAVLGGLGYFYLMLRYVFKSDVEFSVVLAGLGGFAAVLLSMAFFPGTFTVNLLVSAIALVLYAVMLVVYVFSPMKYSIPMSVLTALLIAAVSPMTVVYGIMMCIAAVFMDKKLKSIDTMVGYPDFIPLKVRLTHDGAVKVDSYDNFNRFDGIDDEMESI